MKNSSNPNSPIANQVSKKGARMDHNSNIGFRSSELGRLIRIAVNRSREASGEDPVIVQRGWMVGYLVHNPDKVICQKDLESLFHMPKSTATDTLNVLEGKGYISREPIENDARRKRLVVTDKGRAFCEATERQIDEVEEYVINNIPKDEMEVFFSVMDKIKNNAIEYTENIKEE